MRFFVPMHVVSPPVLLLPPQVELQAARCVLALVADPSNVAGRRAVAAVPGSNVRLQACSTSPNGELKSIAQRIITCLQN